MFSILLVVLLTTAHIHAGSLPSYSRRRTYSASYYASKERLQVFSYSASYAEFYLMSVYHATAGYINSALSSSTSSVYIETGKCGRTYELTVTAFNRYGSSQPQKIPVSSERLPPSIYEPQKSNSVATVKWTNTCEARHDVKIVDQNSKENRVTSVTSPYSFSMQPNMLYAVSVIAVYENGEQPSSLKYLTTGWAGDVKSMSSVSTFHSFQLTWPIADYADLYQINGSSSSDTTFHTSIKTVTNKLEVHGVKAGRRYTFSIKAINELGEGPIRTHYLDAARDIPLIQRVSVSTDGTSRIEWTKAKDNENYYLRINGITGTSYYSGQVTGSVFIWNANSVTVNAYAYVNTADYIINPHSNVFYFGNIASRPVITSVVQTSRSQLRVAATTVGNADRIKIYVYYSFIYRNGNPGLGSRSSTFQTTSPWLASIYHRSGMNYIYYVTVIVDSDRNGNYEASSDTFIYREEPPPSVASVSQSYVSSSTATITWSAPDGYVERYWVMATADTGGEMVTNISTTRTSFRIYGLKQGRYYSASVTTENPVGRGPSQSIRVKTSTRSAYVSRVVQESPYMAKIYVRPATDATRHVLFIDNNRTVEQKTVTAPDYFVIHKLAGSLKLNIRLVASYETGDTTSTYTFQGKCEAGSCAGNASCTLDDDYNPACFCKQYFEGDGSTGCFPLCRMQQVGSYNFTTVPAGKVAYSEEKCASGRSNASVLCEIRRSGSEFQTLFDTLKVVGCDFDLGNITSEASAMTSSGAEGLCRIFELTTSEVSLIERGDVKKIISYLEKLALSDPSMLSQALKYCLLTASHLASYLRVHRDREDAERLLKTLPRLFRYFYYGSPHAYESRDFKWISDNIFAQVTDVPSDIAGRIKEGNFSIYSEFLPLDSTGKPEYPAKIIVPFATVASVYEQISRETECSSSPIRIVFFTYRDSTLFPKSSSSDWVTFLEMGTTKRIGRMNATQKVFIKKSALTPDNSTKSTPLGKFYCGALDAENFLWKNDVCSPVYDETEECECRQFGYYGILKNEVLPPPVSYQMQSSDVVGSTVAVAAMICTIFFFLSERELRAQRDIQALLHVLSTSSISYIVYVSGVSNTTSVEACTVVTWLLHFFILCSWTWVSIFVHTSYASVNVVGIEKAIFVTNQTVECAR